MAIQEDVNGSVNVKGLLIKRCATEEEAIAMIFEGETNRTISEHKLNKASSRSHCVFTIHLEIRSRVESPLFTTAKLPSGACHHADAAS